MSQFLILIEKGALIDNILNSNLNMEAIRSNCILFRFRSSFLLLILVTDFQLF